MNIPKKRISDLFSNIKIGGTPSRGNKFFFGGTHLWVSIADMNGKTEIVSTKEHLTDEGVNNSNCKLIKKGSLLFSFKLTVGKVAFAGADLFTNEAIAAFDAKEAEQNGIDLDYLYFVLPMAAKRDTTKNSMGAALLNKDKIFDLTIPCPSPEQQKIIANHLKAQFSEIEKARQAVEEKKKDLQRINLIQKERFSEFLKTVERVPLSEFLEGIEGGRSIKTTELPAKKDELGILKVSAISWNKFQPDEAKFIGADYHPPEEHRIKKGDLIISRANTLALVGAVVLTNEDYPNRLLSDKTLRLKLKKGSVLPEYLLEILKLPEARAHIEANATGTSDSMRNISQKSILATPIPKANEEEQKLIIKQMSEVRNEAEKINKALNNMLYDLDLLPQRILNQIFNYDQEPITS